MDETTPQHHKGAMLGHADGQAGPHRQTLRHHLVAALGEFVGTFLFLFFGYASHSMIATAERPTPEGLRDGYSAQATVFIALAYAMAILVTVWAMYRISGGLFNPAVCQVHYPFAQKKGELRRGKTKQTTENTDH